jgi:hypothetical protein
MRNTFNNRWVITEVKKDEPAIPMGGGIPGMM